MGADKSKNILVVGELGKGKSALCNCLAPGKFAESSQPQAATTRITVAQDKDKKFRIVDTPGHNDPKLSKLQWLTGWYWWVYGWDPHTNK